MRSLHSSPEKLLSILQNVGSPHLVDEKPLPAANQTIREKRKSNGEENWSSLPADSLSNLCGRGNCGEKTCQ
jgi:hypothetical protein